MASYIEMESAAKELKEYSRDSNYATVREHREQSEADSIDDNRASTRHVVLNEEYTRAAPLEHTEGACVLLGSQYNNGASKEFLEKLFREKCSFTISENKVYYVRDKIETFVTSVLTKIINSDFYVNRVDANISSTLNEFKHPVQFTTVITDRSLVKAGSFYEGTKNKCPEEFDFLCILAECDIGDRDRMQNVASELIEIFYSWVKRYTEYDIMDCFPDDGSLILDTYFVHNGPAAKIEVTFIDSDPEINNLAVSIDLSPAVRIGLDGTLPEDVRLCYPDWKDYILNTGSILMVKVYTFLQRGTDDNIAEMRPSKYTAEMKVTITETELVVMKYIMSEKHRKVYRLLKFMFNGNEAGFETLIKQSTRDKRNREIFRIGHYRMYGFYRVIYNISSYSLKMLVFHHMYQCENTDTETLKPCVINVLRYIVKGVRDTEGSVNLYLGLYWPESTAYSVRVQTMTAKTVEIFDEYRSAMKIADNIADLAECIENTKDEEVTDDHKIMQHIPVISKGSEIVQDTLKSILRSSKRFNYALFITFLLCVIYGLVYFSLDMHYRSDSKVMYCWTGVGGMDGLRHTSFSIFDYLHERAGNQTGASNSDFKSDNERNVSTVGDQLFCLALRYANSERMEVVNVSGLYACRMDTSCSGKHMFQDQKVGNRSQILPLWCDTYAFETVDVLTDFVGSERTSTQAICLQQESCLVISRLTYEDGELKETEVYSNCSVETGCHMNILTDVRLSSYVLYQSKIRKSNRVWMETEVCCCESDSCEKPQRFHGKYSMRYVAFAVAGITTFIIIMLAVAAVKVLCFESRRNYVIFGALSPNIRENSP